MVEIKYGDQYEVVDLAGQTVDEAREQFKAEFGIPDKARATLNGSKIKMGAESETVLNDDDQLSFAVAKSRGVYLLSALLLTIAVTGGVFASGFINASTTLTATIASNFADVSVNSTGAGSISLSGYGFFKHSFSTSTNGTPIFNIDTLTSGYTGDLEVSVYLANTDQLAKQYRVLVLKLGMCYPDGSPMDINESGTIDANDWVMLTLSNSHAPMFPKGTANLTTVRLLGGFYTTHAKPSAGWQGTASPDLYCEVAQR